jgi:hypothetical protein
MNPMTLAIGVLPTVPQGIQDYKFQEVTMQRLKLATVVMILAMALAALAVKFHVKVVPVAKASEGCSAKTLHGTYGGVANALTLPNATPGTTPQSITAFQPFDVLEVINFDGSGNFQSTVTASVGGTPAQSFQDTGTYTVNTNCTGSLATASGFTFDLIVFRGGREVRFMETDGSGVAAFTETRMLDEE